MNIVPFPTITPVFDWNYNSRAEIVINQGGTSSGKTFAIMQVLLIRAITERNTTITVVGGDIPDLKSGALRDTKNIVATSDFVRSQIVSFNVVDRTYFFRSGSIIEFKSYQDEYDARSGKRQYLFVNEAQNIAREVFDELHDRTFKQTFIDYNPTTRFWAHDLHGQPGVQVFISNFTHNPYCDPKVIRSLLRYRTANPARWRVYGMGLTGEVEGSIFRRVFQADAFPSGCEFVYGLDFGYANDPTALCRMAKVGRWLYGQQLIYEPGLSDARLARKIEAAGVTPYEKIIADAADPKAIDTLRGFGLWVEPAEKGPDSVQFGIEQINDTDRFDGLYLVGENPDWWTEQENYVWQKKNGKYINKPVDAFNHLWDACRYATRELISGGSGILASG